LLLKGGARDKETTANGMGRITGKEKNRNTKRAREGKKGKKKGGMKKWFALQKTEHMLFLIPGGGDGKISVIKKGAPRSAIWGESD